MRARAPVALALAIAAVLTVTPTAAAVPDLQGEGDEDAVTITAREARAAEEAAAAVPPAVRLVEYKRADGCIAGRPPFGTSLGPCGSSDLPLPRPDCDGLAPIEPLWRRTRSTPADSWSLWDYVTGWSCPQDLLPAFTAADFRRLPLAPPAIHLQPNTGRVLVNMPLITLTDATPQLLVTDLLGYDVEVDATPVSYSWNFGDGSAPLVTTSPGHPYPNHDVSHPYPRAGSFQVTLTVTYSGRYRLAGTTAWLPVAGTATTTATSPPILAEEAPSRLVATDCAAQPRPAGC